MTPRDFMAAAPHERLNAFETPISLYVARFRDNAARSQWVYPDATAFPPCGHPSAGVTFLSSTIEIPPDEAVLSKGITSDFFRVQYSSLGTPLFEALKVATADTENDMEDVADGKAVRVSLLKPTGDSEYMLTYYFGVGNGMGESNTIFTGLLGRSVVVPFGFDEGQNVLSKAGQMIVLCKIIDSRLGDVSRKAVGVVGGPISVPESLWNAMKAEEEERKRLGEMKPDAIDLKPFQWTPAHSEAPTRRASETPAVYRPSPMHPFDKQGVNWFERGSSTPRPPTLGSATPHPIPMSPMIPTLTQPFATNPAHSEAPLVPMLTQPFSMSPTIPEPLVMACPPPLSALHTFEQLRSDEGQHMSFIPTHSAPRLALPDIPAANLTIPAPFSLHPSHVDNWEGLFRDRLMVLQSSALWFIYHCKPVANYLDYCARTEVKSNSGGSCGEVVASAFLEKGVDEDWAAHHFFEEFFEIMRNNSTVKVMIVDGDEEKKLTCTNPYHGSTAFLAPKILMGILWNAVRMLCIVRNMKDPSTKDPSKGRTSGNDLRKVANTWHVLAPTFETVTRRKWLETEPPYNQLMQGDSVHAKKWRAVVLQLQKASKSDRVAADGSRAEQVVRPVSSTKLLRAGINKWTRALGELLPTQEEVQQQAMAVAQANIAAQVLTNSNFQSHGFVDPSSSGLNVLSL